MRRKLRIIFENEISFLEKSHFRFLSNTKILDNNGLGIVLIKINHGKNIINGYDDKLFLQISQILKIFFKL